MLAKGRGLLSPFSTTAAQYSSRLPALQLPALQRRQHACLHVTRAAAADESAPVDGGALAKYGGAFALQTGVMTGTLFGLQQVTQAVGAMDNLPGGVEGETAAKALVTLFFLVTSIKSRIFSPLDASRPNIKGEKKAIDEKKRPSWMPPPPVFPIVWSTIGLLRCISSVLVWEASGRDLLTTPLIIFCAHLAIGDVWNHINNIEKRMGVAVPGVLCCWASAVAATVAYYQADHTAGQLLAPSAVWIGIASALIYSIWDLNRLPDGSRDSLYPVKQQQ
ncbi:TspO/MBR-related protein [Dunaliella salina]|uniref:TspO/MBR-related protein n=1 Tax=Dunaliella salina TaxID=3046 RepID=A0ABQ7GBI1_DUNSA|nr:TspO/MBR-related protein [Dunaliella salina]|eukprot:KAF5831969.1 TspO/MBR-related protein [Dunaliella salina]